MPAIKKLILSLAATLAAVSLLQAQEPDYRIGKVSEEELRMERYDRDPDAVAYNLVDGKVVKTPLKKQYLFREQVGEEQCC